MLVQAGKQDTLLPRIQAAAVRHFAARGVEGTTIRDIARGARVSEGALYRHFRSKEDLARWMYVEHLKVFTDFLERRIAAGRTLVEQVRITVEAFVEAVEDSPDLARFMLYSDAGELMRPVAALKAPQGVLLGMIRRACAARVIRSRARPEILHALFLGALTGFLRAHAAGRIRGRLRSHTPAVTRACLRLLESPQE